MKIINPKDKSILRIYDSKHFSSFFPPKKITHIFPYQSWPTKQSPSPKRFNLNFSSISLSKSPPPSRYIIPDPRPTDSSPNTISHSKTLRQKKRNSCQSWDRPSGTKKKVVKVVSSTVSFPSLRNLVETRDARQQWSRNEVVGRATTRSVAIARSRWTTPQVWFRCGCSPEAVTVNRYSPPRNIQFRMESGLDSKNHLGKEHDTSLADSWKDYLFVR